MFKFFCNYCRSDGTTFTFATGNILWHDSKFFSYFHQDSFINTFSQLMKNGVYWKTKKRKVGMYLYGSTITATRYPKFIHEGKEYVLPRPYKSSKSPHTSTGILPKNHVLKWLVKEIERIVIHFLQYHCEDRKLAKLSLYHVARSKKKIPSNLRLFKNVFTHCTVVGTFQEVDGEIPPHFDEKDLISVVFHCGHVINGGSTLYYNGISKNNIGETVYSVPFQHGRIKIGFFQNVIHSVEKWKGTRCLINFNLKAKVLHHFEKYGMQYYSKFMESGYPSGTFVSF